MKQKFVLQGGPFDGHVGEAYTGVTEFWKKSDEADYHYSRISSREFKYDKIRPKKRSEKAQKRESER